MNESNNPIIRLNFVRPKRKQRNIHTPSLIKFQDSF